ALFLIAAFALVLNVNGACNCTSYTSPVPLHVKIGFFLMNLYTLNTMESTVKADFYVWMKWPICTLDPDGNPFRPDNTLTIENMEQRPDLKLKRYFEEPLCDDAADGYNYNQWRLEGVFTQVFSFFKYPLDSHELVFVFEVTFFC